MSSFISKFPQENINGNPALPSKWIAVHNPIIYEIQRRDYQIASVTEHTLIVFPLVNVRKVTLFAPVTAPDTININDKIYLKSGNYDVETTVTTILNATQFLIATPFLGSSTGGFINLTSIRQNFRIETEILKVVNNQYFPIGTTVNFPDNKGKVKLDVSPFLKTLTGYKNEYQYSVLNQADLNLGNTFNIRFVDKWIAQSNAVSSAPVTGSTKFFFVNAAKQISNKYGQNMGEFVPVPFTTSPLAKFLSGFVRPTMFSGFPLDVSFIYSDNISGFQVRLRQQQKDINNNILLNSAPQNLDVAGRRFVNRLLVSLPSFDQSANVKSIHIFLEIDNTAINTSYVSNTYGPATFIQSVPASFDVPDSPT